MSNIRGFEVNGRMKKKGRGCRERRCEQRWDNDVQMEIGNFVRSAVAMHTSFCDAIFRGSVIMHREFYSDAQLRTMRTDRLV